MTYQGIWESGRFSMSVPERAEFWYLPGRGAIGFAINTGNLYFYKANGAWCKINATS